MADVVREILLCLFVAAALGGAIGWLARGQRSRRVADSQATASLRALEELRLQLRSTEAARAEARGRVAALETAAETAGQQAQVLRRELREAELARDTARHDISGTRDQFMKLSAHLQEAEGARDVAKAEANASRTAAADARARILDIESQRDAARRENVQLQASQAASAADTPTQQRLETLRATLQAAERGWDSARAQVEDTLQQLNATRRQLAQSEVDRNALLAQMADAQAPIIVLTSTDDGAQASLPPPVAPGGGLSSDRQPEAPSAARARGKAGRDDLQQIRGIGPALERTLHRAGIFRYAQIAAWTREDVLAMGRRLAGLHDRIVRERWPAAARRLHIAKYGSPPDRASVDAGGG